MLRWSSSSKAKKKCRKKRRKYLKMKRSNEDVPDSAPSKQQRFDNIEYQSTNIYENKIPSLPNENYMERNRMEEAKVRNEDTQTSRGKGKRPVRASRRITVSSHARERSILSNNASTIGMDGDKRQEHLDSCSNVGNDRPYRTERKDSHQSWARHPPFRGVMRRRCRDGEPVLRASIRRADSHTRFLSFISVLVTTILAVPAAIYHIIKPLTCSLYIGAEYLFYHFLYRPFFFAPRVRQTHNYVSEAGHENGDIRISENGLLVARDNRNWFQRMTSTVYIGVTTLHLSVQETITHPFKAKVDRAHFFDSAEVIGDVGCFASSSSSSSSSSSICHNRNLSGNEGAGAVDIGGEGNRSHSLMKRNVSRSDYLSDGGGTHVSFEDKCKELLSQLARYHGGISRGNRSSAVSSITSDDSVSSSGSSSWMLLSLPWSTMNLKVPLAVTRHNVFDSAAEQILAASHQSIFRGLNIIFKDDNSGRWEAGVDAGGLTKEFFSSVVSEVVHWTNSIQVSEFHSPYSPNRVTAADGANDNKDIKDPLPSSMPSRLMRQVSNEVRGFGQPVFHALPDNSIMIKASNRPPMYYMALGRIFGAVTVYSLRGDGVTLPVSLSSALLKFMTARPITADDVRAVDPILFQNRMEIMMRPNGINVMKQILLEDELFFTTDLEPCGAGGDKRRRASSWRNALSSLAPLEGVAVHDFYANEDEEENFEGYEEDELLNEYGNQMHKLKPDGEKEKVTEANKYEYITLLSEHYLCGNVRREISAFLRGFHELVPLANLETCGITEKDLGLILTGMPRIDVEDWRRNCDIEPNFGAVQPFLQLWWDCLAGLSDEKRAKVLQFSTGLSHLPAGGFQRLKPKFKVVIQMNLLSEGASHESKIQRLPTAHTCFNTIEVPPYATVIDMREKLMLAVTEGSGSFGFA